MSKTLALETAANEVTVKADAESGGLNAAFDETVYCVAAEPHATFLRISVLDGKDEVASATAVIGRIRRGYRVFRLRDVRGQRIELGEIEAAARTSQIGRAHV